MESEPVRRKSCLLRLRENCPFRKLRRHTYDLSAGASSPAGRFWNDARPSTADQPISIVCSEPLPPPSRYQCACSPGQSEADIHMEEDAPAAQNQQLNQQNPESRAEEQMELDHDIDPETGEKAMG